MTWFVAAAALAGLLQAGPSGGATVFVRSGGDLQAALNQARDGDVVLLEAGATFVGNFVLPARPSSAEPIIVRTSASDARLPAEMARVSPEVADLLPKLRSPNGEPALRTAPGARGWRLVLLGVPANLRRRGRHHPPGRWWRGPVEPIVGSVRHLHRSLLSSTATRGAVRSGASRSTAPTRRSRTAGSRRSRRAVRTARRLPAGTGPGPTDPQQLPGGGRAGLHARRCRPGDSRPGADRCVLHRQPRDAAACTGGASRGR